MAKIMRKERREIFEKTAERPARATEEESIGAVGRQKVKSCHKASAKN